MNIQQGTVNFSQIFSDSNRLNVYYAIQADARDEPPATDGNSFPNEGDKRSGRRQLISLVDSWVISPALVNEARIGGNRIHIVFNPDNMDNPTTLGINNGVSGPIGLPQITVSGAFVFGGNSGFPQGRGDTTAVVSDTLSWIHGNHTIKLGGEDRRANSNNFSATPGTLRSPASPLSWPIRRPALPPHLQLVPTALTTMRSACFVTDNWKVAKRLTVTLGLRYEWNRTPTEAGGRYVVFNPRNGFAPARRLRPEGPAMSTTRAR